jgi:phosphodiesterase/alkaline phosphatase D-like protein
MSQKPFTMLVDRNRFPGATVERGLLGNRLTRRGLIGGAGAVIGLVATPGVMRIAKAQSWPGGNPFTLGIAAGAPRPDGFVLWTRLAPDPLSTDPETPGGMSGGDITLRYEIAADPGMTNLVRQGGATAERAFGYSVHLDVHDSKVPNPVVISGDIHSFFANDLKLDFYDPSSPTVATEFVGTSISSYGPPYDPIAQALPDNPHVHFFESRRRGYVVADLAPDHTNARRLRCARAQGRHQYAEDLCR